MKLTTKQQAAIDRMRAKGRPMISSQIYPDSKGYAASKLRTLIRMGLVRISGKLEVGGRQMNIYRLEEKGKQND